jgi:hypothetical protein
MVVRIKFAKGRKLAHGRKNRHVALATAALLTPATFVTTVLAVWRVAADLHIAGQFAIDSGIFSHWQSWLGAAVLLHLCSRALNRYGRQDGTAAP